MFTVIKSFRFEAGHQLIHHDGACKEPHGHSYSLEVQVKGDSLIDSGPKKNMVLDFHHISDIVEPMIDSYLDHKWLNDTLETDSPTSEFIARWIYRHLKEKLPSLHTVTLSETATSKVIYTEN